MSNGSSMLKEILQNTFTKYVTKEGATVSPETQAKAQQFTKEVLSQLAVRLLVRRKALEQEAKAQAKAHK